eukprot:723819-Amphidinium_carterae.1
MAFCGSNERAMKVTCAISNFRERPPHVQDMPLYQVACMHEHARRQVFTASSIAALPIHPKYQIHDKKQ